MLKVEVDLRFNVCVCVCVAMEVDSSAGAALTPQVYGVRAGGMRVCAHACKCARVVCMYVCA